MKAFKTWYVCNLCKQVFEGGKEIHAVVGSEKTMYFCKKCMKKLRKENSGLFAE